MDEEEQSINQAAESKQISVEDIEVKIDLTNKKKSLAKSRGLDLKELNPTPASPLK